MNSIPLRKGEILALRKLDKVKTSVFAERARVIRKSSVPGLWKNSTTPYLRGIMDILSITTVRSVAVGKGVQTGMTEAAYNFLLQQMHDTSDNAMLVMADEKSVKKMSKERLLPMLFDSPVMKSYISSNPDDMGIYEIRLLNGFNCYIGWGTSQQSVASIPCRVVVMDEIDKYSSSVVIGEAKARTQTYTHTSKILMFSTPGLPSGPIDYEMSECDDIFEYHVCCRFCGTFQVMQWENFDWNRDLSITKLRQLDAGRYKCEHCSHLWTDSDRDIAVSGGFWQSKEQNLTIEELEQSKLSRIGVHLPAWLSTFVPLTKVIVEYLEAEKAADSGVMRSWCNNIAAIPFEDIKQAQKWEELLVLRDERPRGLVPTKPCVLLCGIDTQMRGFYYEVRAFGFGSDLESWQIREGFVETFKGLEQILYDDVYRDAHGKEYQIMNAIIDSGGTMTDTGISRTAEIYEFCRLNPKVIACKGHIRLSKNFNVSVIDNFPNTNKPIPGGVRLHNLNVTYYKDWLWGKLAIHPIDAGAWHQHSDFTEDQARQLVSEVKDDKGHWVVVNKKKANHFWDVAVYILALADILGVRYMQEITNEEQGNKKVTVKQQPKGGNRRWW